VLNEGGEVDLGFAWSTAGMQDLMLVYQEPDDGNLLAGTVHFGEKALISGPAGDYNGDGKVDAADYVVWRKNPAAHGGDPGGYNAWRINFGATSGGVGALSAYAVPETAGAALMTFVVLGCGLMPRRNRAA
jgi:hypothetical protein